MKALCCHPFLIPPGARLFFQLTRSYSFFVVSVTLLWVRVLEFSGRDIPVILFAASLTSVRKERLSFFSVINFSLFLVPLGKPPSFW